jgi:hypothetical protein
MKIYNGDKIIPGILIAVVLFSFPFWFTHGKAAPAPEVSLDTPAIKKLATKECIAPKEYMRTSHMVVLNEWRDTAVRDNQRVFTAANGKTYDINLQNTCMECHSNKSQFCDQCHNYTGVNPYCWNCHIEPKEIK